jgi:hypothetical protein
MAPAFVALARSLAIAAVAGLFMAYVGAFGTQAAPIGQRFGYWLTTMIGASIIGAAIFYPAEARGWLERRPIPIASILALAMALPLTGLVWLTTALFFAPLRSLDPRLLAPTFPPVLLISAIMTAINYLAAPRSHATHAAPAGAAPAKFLERLPLKLRGGELYAVQAEDHYLRLHTSRGSDLILLRLADAVAELDGIEGAQTHRSWWVAKAAVADARRSDGRAVLTLRNGIEAPVSRSYAGALKDGGWF